MSSPAVPWASNVKNVVGGFLGWRRWAERLDITCSSGQLKAHEYPGVYLFADFRKKMPPPTTIRTYPPRHSPPPPLLLVIIFGIKFDRPEQLRDPRLLSPLDVLLKCLGHGGLLRPVTTSPDSLLKQLVIDGQVCCHV